MFPSCLFFYVILMLTRLKVSSLTLSQILRETRQTTTDIEWTPQLGTFMYPKIPSLSPDCRPGDVYLMNDNNLYLATVKGDVHETIPSENSTSFRLLEKGSFYNPKLTLIDEPVNTGEIFYNEEESQYYYASCEDECELLYLDVKSDWMRLVHDYIKDLKISELAIPGTHDSASWGINEKSDSVDGRVSWLHYWWPQTMVNWTRTQTENLLTQLEAGFRELDLRITDMGEEDGGFMWWHILTADPIEPGLKQIKYFIENHPYEIIIIDFQHFKRPSRLKPIIHSRIDILSDIILSYLKPYMLTRNEASMNPTVDDVLSVGKNIIAFVEDPYMQSLSTSYWPKKIIHSEWQGMSNPEVLFNHRSRVLIDFKNNYPSYITDTSGAITLDHDSISIGQDYSRSFEGTFYDLISLTRFGANTGGMRVRNKAMYSSGHSVHYRGINDMYKYWLARPSLYKPNIIYVDDAVKSSTIVETAIEANMQQVKREVAVTFQGSPRTGYYRWFEGEITGAKEAVMCAQVIGRFIINSQELSFNETFTFEEMPEIILKEGAYPPDSQVIVQVTQFNSSEWHDLYANNIQVMINNNIDLYVRGGEADTSNGREYFAYISLKYNLFGETCDMAPVTGFENIVVW